MGARHIHLLPKVIFKEALQIFFECFYLCDCLTVDNGARCASINEEVSAMAIILFLFPIAYWNKSIKKSWRDIPALGV